MNRWTDDTDAAEIMADPAPSFRHAHRPPGTREHRSEPQTLQAALDRAVDDTTPRGIRGLAWGLLLVIPLWGLSILALFVVGYALGMGWR